MDILFRDSQPFSATPGGSSFNSIISIGRTHLPCTFIGYAGNDRIGRQTQEYLSLNGVDTSSFKLYDGLKSSLALAFLDHNGDAEYQFYKDSPHIQGQWQLPHFTPNDILLYGSYYAISPGTRHQVETVLASASQAQATIYYDINFRPSHKDEIPQLLPVIQQNCRQSTIVRGSTDDFEILFGTRDPQDIYHQHISQYCHYFICTSGAGLIHVFTPRCTMQFHTPHIPQDKIVSTVGAGDNFNAGFLCAMHSHSVTPTQLATLTPSQWETLINNGIRYASIVCQSASNNIPRQ